MQAFDTIIASTSNPAINFLLELLWDKQFYDKNSLVWYDLEAVIGI